MGTAGGPIPCDSEQEVMSHFRVVHRDGDVARKPIEIGQTQRGRCLSIGSMENARGTRWRGVTDFNLGTIPDFSYSPAESYYAPASLRRTSRATGWTPGMYQEGDYR
jgi:hypothetical protein